MKPDLSAYLGARVVIVIDRPLGSPHPCYPDTVYGVNYGELPGTVSGDGHSIDAYVLGPAVPVECVKGTVIALVVRDDDVEDKLVVHTGSRPVSAEEVWERILFQERYFRARLVLLEP